jgi:hypothetical protein
MQRAAPPCSARNRDAAEGVLPMMRPRPLGALALLLVLVGCELLGPQPQPPECTAIGCDNQLRAVVAQDLQPGVEYEIEMCVGTRCAEADISVPEGGGAVGASDGSITLETQADAVVFRLPDADWSGVHRVTATVRDATSGEPLADVDVDAEVEFQRSQPNGPGCPPICWFAEVRA